MSHVYQPFVGGGSLNQLPPSLSILGGPCTETVCVLYLQGPLRAPLTGELRHRVRALLGRGERTIVLDLARVSKIDAAGIGQLVRVYNVTVAAKGMLQIVHAAPWIREILERVHILGILTSGIDRREARLLS